MNYSVYCAALATLLLSSCTTTPRIDPLARVTKVSPDRYRIEMHGDFTYWGGPCIPFPIPSRGTEFYCLYVSSLRGQVPADAVELVVPERNVARPPIITPAWTIRPIKGSVTFTNKTMIVDLQEPRYTDQSGKLNRSGMVDHYEPFRLNGEFQIELLGQ